MASVFAFDVDDCMESGGQQRLPPTSGPVSWQSLRDLARDGHVVGICGNWSNVPPAVPDWREFLSFFEVRPHPGYSNKHEALNRIRAAYPGYDHYVMVGNDPGKHSQRPAYWDRLYPGDLPVQHVPGQALLSDDIGAAARAGWEFIKEDQFAAGQRTGSVPPVSAYPGQQENTPPLLPDTNQSARPSMIYKHIEAPEVLKVDDQRGIVEAIVSVTGNLDRQNDVIAPGAWKAALADRGGKVPFRMPSIAIDHQWGARTMLGRTLDAEELMPGDPRLPQRFKEQGWGGLWVQGQFNLDKQIAREAYSDLKGGFVTEFSVGFDVAQDEKGVKAEEHEDGKRIIKSVGNWYEWSPVFMGANPATMATAVKEHQPEKTLDELESEADLAELLERAASLLPSVERQDWVLGLKSDVSTQGKRSRARFSMRVNGKIKYPINDCGDVKDAWKLRGRSSIPRARVEAYVRRAAAKLNCSGPWSGKSEEPEGDSDPFLIPPPEQYERIYQAFAAVQEGVHALQEMAPDPAAVIEEIDTADVTEASLKHQAALAVGFAAALAAQKKRTSHSLR